MKGKQEDKRRFKPKKEMSTQKNPKKRGGGVEKGGQKVFGREDARVFCDKSDARRSLIQSCHFISDLGTAQCGRESTSDSLFELPHFCMLFIS